METDEAMDQAAPLDAVTEAAETTTAAAGELLDFLTSGQREALIAAGVALGVLVGQLVLKRLLKAGVRRLPRRDAFSWSALASRIIGRYHLYFMVAAALFAADRVVRLPDIASDGVALIFILAALVQFGEVVQEAASSWVRRLAQRRAGDASTLASAVNVLKWLIGVAVWSTVLLLILDNIGADVTALIAGLGIGGIALGLAAQGVFRDLFSAVSIILDAPFRRGDTIRYGETWGAIEDIGLKTTRIRSLHGEQIVISNTNLLDHEIHNMRRMARRRVETGFGVVYQTDPDVAERIVGMVSKLVNGIEGVELDRCNFAGFGASSLDYELVFYSLNPELRRTKAVTGKVLLAVFRLFRDEGIDFAYPTQTLHVASAPEGPLGAFAVRTQGEDANPAH